LPFFDALSKWVKKKRRTTKITRWEKQGKPFPPPHAFKEQILQDYSEKFNLDIFVETGTYYGEMVEALKDTFKYIYSIELSKELYEKANEKFKGEKHIELIWGDSGVELEKITGKLDRPALFWLDAHYSSGVTARGKKDTPIYEELDHILNAKCNRHVIVIDDARDFGVDAAYPSLEELFAFVRSKRNDVEIAVQDDTIRITPKF